MSGLGALRKRELRQQVHGPDKSRARLGKIGSSVSAGSAETRGYAGFPRSPKDPCRARAKPLGPPRLTKWELLDGLRPHSSKTTRACRRKRVSPTVQLQLLPDGSKRVSGVMSCNSVWACPVCAQKICGCRADELKLALREWSGPVSMLSLTVRHARGHSCRKVRRGVALAWRRIMQGRKAERLRELFHIRFHVRALEVTHGKNGWHPHLHVLVFGSAPPEPEALEYLQGLWISAVEKELGKDHAPNWEHGVALSESRRDTYLAKMGLEVTHSSNKSARGPKGRTPWNIAQDAVAGDVASQRLWREYTAAMKGAKQLTWSRGMRRHFGLGQRASDADVAAAIDAAEADELRRGGVVVAEWDGAAWDARAQADPFWVSRVASSEVSELRNLPALRRALAVVEPKGGAGPPLARSDT